MTPRTVDLPGGEEIQLPPEAARIVTARICFVEFYAVTKGWDPTDLSIDQILEIRGEEKWKNP